MERAYRDRGGRARLRCLLRVEELSRPPDGGLRLVEERGRPRLQLQRPRERPRLCREHPRRRERARGRTKHPAKETATLRSRRSADTGGTPQRDRPTLGPGKVTWGLRGGEGPSRGNRFRWREEANTGGPQALHQLNPETVRILQALGHFLKVKVKGSRSHLSLAPLAGIPLVMPQLTWEVPHPLKKHVRMTLHRGIPLKMFSMTSLKISPFGQDTRA